MNTRVRTTLQAMKAPLNPDKVSAHHRSLLVINLCDFFKKINNNFSASERSISRWVCDFSQENEALESRA
jgi:hypothetical protein